MPTAHVSLLRPVEAQIPSRRPKAPRSRQPRATVKPASLRISCKPIIPFTILPARFCSLIPPIAHNKTMPHSPLQLEPFSPPHGARSEAGAQSWTSPPVRVHPENSHPPVLRHIFALSPLRSAAPLQTNHLPDRKKYPPPHQKICSLPQFACMFFGGRMRRFFASAAPLCAFPQTRYH